jgi:hypothetical protein
MTDTRTVLIGLCVLAATSLVVFWRGGRLERLGMTLTVFCWAAAAIGQLATGNAVIPVILADLVLAAALLVMVLRHHLIWLYLLFGVEALRLLLHATAFEFDMGPAHLYRLTNNVLSTVGLFVLLAAAVWPRRTAKISETDATEAPEASEA